MDDLGVHLLRCPCKNERIIAHDMLQNTIVAIASKSGAHIQRKVSHLFPRHTQRQVDIVITRNNFQTLVKVVIANLICTNLVQYVLIMIAYAIIIVVQNKTLSYTK
jgi:predicted PurR-regulated permease PerM